MLEEGGKREIEWGVGFVLTTEWVGSKSFVKSLLCGWVVRKWRMLECVKVWRRRVRANNVFSAHLRSFSLGQIVYSVESTLVEFYPTLVVGTVLY